MDWVAISAVCALAVALIAIVGAGAGYGATRQKVTDLHLRVDNQDRRLDKLDEAIGEARKTGEDVRMLGETLRSFKENTGLSHQLILGELKHFSELWSERLDNMRRAGRLSRPRGTKPG